MTELRDDPGDPRDDGMTVGRAARLLGVSPSTLRYYDEIDLVRVEKDGSGYRRYRTPQLRAVAAVRAAQELGFTLDEIRRLILLDPRAREARKDLAERKIRQIDEAMATMSTIRAFLEHARTCTCHDADQCQTAVPEFDPSRLRPSPAAERLPGWWGEQEQDDGHADDRAGHEVPERADGERQAGRPGPR